MKNTNPNLKVVPVPGNVSSATFHPAVRASLKSLEKGYANHATKIISTFRNGTFKISVSKNEVDRAIRFMESVVRSSLANGWSVVIPPTPGARRVSEEERAKIQIGDYAISISILEHYRRLELPKAEWTTFEKYRYELTGRLSFRIEEWAWRQTWSDKRDARIEDMLPQIVSSLLSTSQKMQEWHLERAAEDKRAEIERKRREAMRLRVEEEKDRRHRLLKAVRGWQQTSAIRQLADEVKLRTAQHPDLLGDATRWIKWVNQVAANIDPFENGYFREAFSGRLDDGGLNCEETNGDYW